MSGLFVLVADSWRFTSVPLSEDQRRHVFPNGTLRLAEVTSSDLGTYQCLASDGRSQAYSQRATLHRACESHVRDRSLITGRGGYKTGGGGT